MRTSVYGRSSFGSLGTESFFHFESFLSTGKVHHSVLLFQLVFHFTHLFLDFKSFLDHSDTEYEEEESCLRMRMIRLALSWADCSVFLYLQRIACIAVKSDRPLVIIHNTENNSDNDSLQESIPR
jgi:hypothetical protein